MSGNVILPQLPLPANGQAYPGPRATIYARVSTDIQAEHGYSLPTQLQGCHQYATKNGFTVLEELVDDCSGNIPIAERPQGKRLYELVDQGQVNKVILYTHDRTARDEKVIEYLLFKTFLYDRGVELHYADAGLDPYTMEANLVGYIKAHGAADERKKIRKRTAQGKIDKALDGKWMGTRPPLGYCKVGQRREAKLEINEEEAKLVLRIYYMYVGWNGYRVHDMLGIAVLLTAEGIPVSGRGRKSARGWTQETVRYILRNTAYIGQFRYKDIIVHLPELAIVSRELWEAAQQRRKTNAVKAQRNRRVDYLLSGGYFRCTCGRAMVGRTTWGSGKEYHYYACVNQRRRYLYGCTERYMRADVVDELVWNWLHDLLADEEKLEAGINRIIERNETELTPRKDRLKTVNDLIEHLNRTIKRLAKTVADLSDDEENSNDEASEALSLEIKQAQKKLNALKEEHARLEAQIQQGMLTPEEIALIKQTAAELREELDQADFEAKRFLIDRLNLRATIRHTEEGRMLDVSCELVIEPVSLPIETSRFQAGGCNRQKIILSALLTIDHPAPRLILCPNPNSTKKSHPCSAEVSYVVSA